MKALSLKQPWATLIVSGIKNVENRKWRTNYRGRILIHASKQIDKQALSNMQLRFGFRDDFLIVGGIIGDVEIIDCVTKHDSEWFEGPYGFILKNAKIRRFIPYKGKLGIFDISEII